MNYKKTRIEAVVLTVVLIGAMLLAPASSFMTEKNDEKNIISEQDDLIIRDPTSIQKNEGYWLDQNYNLFTDPSPISKDDTNDDGGYKKDARNELDRGAALFPGELIDDTPGRGRTGKLSPTDDQDWYYFQVCEGQQIIVTMTPPVGYDYDLSLWSSDEIMRDESSTPGSAMETVTYIADYTGSWYICMLFVSGTDEAQYLFTVDLIGQNDAGTSSDVGNDFAHAHTITPGTYIGYLDMNDPYDWYKFDVTDGDGLQFVLSMQDLAYLTDFDIHLYNPSGEMVYEQQYYYDDVLYYPADVTGEWRVEIDIFPGWVDVPQPTEWNYYSYGSGPYELQFIIQSSVPDPPDPIPQPDITPVAKTFIINDDPNSNRDEYGYMAAIPACNYLNGGDRYLAPIVYQGDDTSTNYYGTEYDRGVVDDTTQYLIDDWNDYLLQYGKTAVEYEVPEDPIEAAADIAMEWGSSDLAVIAVDGSGYEDNVRTVLSKTRTLKREVEVEILDNDDEAIINIGGTAGYPMFLGPKWCAINVSMSAGGAEPSLNAILPHFMNFMQDWWPYTYDGDGEKIDIYFPVLRPGVWTAGTNTINGDWSFEITKYAGDRHRFRVSNSDSVINVKVETDEPSDLIVFLIDPEGHLRSPDIPQWNGPVNPMHMWNGCHFDPEVHGFGPWRTWNPEASTEFKAEVLHPEKGWWTAIVVPRHAEGENVRYQITGEVTITNPDRADAAISAANAAVIASQENVPLLYVTEDGIPSQTQDAIDALGVESVIFVERGRIGSGVTGLPNVEADLTTMQDIVDYIKGYDHSENYITITSLKYSKGESTNQPTQNGYFAPAAMIAAYHCSPVLRIGDAVVDGILKTKANPAGMADRIETYRLWSGDFYHGSRSTGHLPEADHPVDQNKLNFIITMIKFLLNGSSGELPPFGRDAKRYWNADVHDGIKDFISGLGLDLEGQEGYCFVAPRKDIYIIAHSVMMGINSYAGHMVGETPAYTAAMVSRNVLYPALIYANPARDITTTQLMNFPDGGSWTTNNGVATQVYSSRLVKQAFGSHGRTYEGHCLWEAHIERMNNGASAMYYSGHGTGGSGISAQYYQTEFCNYEEQIWWDAWRGYSYDNWKMPRSNGQVWYNAAPPNLYDIIHYDYVDELTENLRSNAIFYMSCTTADADGPMVYLDHGAVVYYGNAGSGLCPQADLQDDIFFEETMINGKPIGPAFADTVWLHYRDFTLPEDDERFNQTMYGVSSLYPITTVQMIYGDPALIIYSPEWTAPEPIDA